MVFTRAQSKRKAAGEPIYSAPLARKAQRDRNLTRITDLPNELLLEVFSYIYYADEQSYTIRSLRLVSQHFNILATPSLYVYKEFNKEEATPSFPLFLTTILRAPFLATHTKNPRWILRPDQVSLDDKAPMTSTINAWRIPGHQRWLTAMEQGHHEDYLAVALGLMPNIMSFDYQPNEPPIIDANHPPAHLELLLSGARGIAYGTIYSFAYVSYLT